MTDDLVAFATARLDEDAAVARAASGEGSAAGDSWHQDDPERRPGLIRDQDHGVVVYDEGSPVAEQAVHMTRHDPARVLREVEAKRAILAMHRPTRPHPEFGFTYPAAANFCGWCGPGDNWQAEQEPDHYPFALWPCRHARLVVAVWDDHPDYRQEWKP